MLKSFRNLKVAFNEQGRMIKKRLSSIFVKECKAYLLVLLIKMQEFLSAYFNIGHKKRYNFYVFVKVT